MSVLASLSACAELVNSDLEQRDEKGNCVGWYLPRKYRYERGAGSNGSWGIAYTSDGSALQGYASQSVKLEPGAVYRFGAWVRAEDVSGKGPCFICLGVHDKDNKYLTECRTSAVRKSTNGEWVKLEGVSRAMPAAAAKGGISFCVETTLHGKFFFDKAYFEKYVREPVVAVYSSAYRNEAFDGDVDFAAPLTPDAFGCRDAKVTFEIRGANTSFTLPAERPSADVARVKVAVDRLARSTNEVVCTVRSGARLIGAAAMSFVRLERPAKRRVTIDRYGRTVLDGKLFFPYGMYTGRTFFNPTNFARYCESAFNCFMEYGHPNRQELDRAAKAGLYSIQDLAAWYGQPDKGTNSVLRQMSVKNHPALLGWYLFDEQPVLCVPVLNDRYRFVSAFDPDHPVWCAQDLFCEARQYIGACDVFGGDPYPISSRPITLATDAIRQETTGLMGMRPIWQVVQYFGWNWHDPRQAHQRRPSKAEVRNMTWQAIAGGARGLIYYAYGYLCDKTEIGGEKVDALWNELKEVAAEVKGHERVLLFAETQPIANLPAGVVGRTFREKGETWTLLVNTSAKTLLDLEPLGVSFRREVSTMFCEM